MIVNNKFISFYQIKDDELKKKKRIHEAIEASIFCVDY